MRIGTAMATLGLVGVCSAITADVARAQSAEVFRAVTFELTSLTRSDLHLQHGVLNYVTLSMKDVADGKAVSIKDAPPFPLIATLHYRDREGGAREVATTCDYRC